VYKPLSAEAIKEIHKGSLEVLSDVGIAVASHEARSIFSRHGARIVDDNRVIIPPQLVKDARCRAREIAKEYIKNHIPRGLTPHQEQKILAEFPDIVKDPEQKNSLIEKI